MPTIGLFTVVQTTTTFHTGFVLFGNKIIFPISNLGGSFNIAYEGEVKPVYWLCEGKIQELPIKLSTFRYPWPTYSTLRKAADKFVLADTLRSQGYTIIHRDIAVSRDIFPNSVFVQSEEGFEMTYAGKYVEFPPVYDDCCH